MYIIVLHPRHKLSYFKTARWEDEWMATAEWLVRDEFASSYMNIEANNSINIVEATPDKEKDIKVRMLTILLWLADSIIYKGYKSIQQPSCPHPSQSCRLGLRN